MLFMSGSVGHRHLHSFPTRRSSDLRHRAGLQRVLRAGLLSRRPAEGSQEGAGARSEEHTSELQSRFDLVCRLLLEKNKTCTTSEHKMIYEQSFHRHRVIVHTDDCLM